MSNRPGLLILSRRVGESIVVGNDVTITVLGLRSSSGVVRLGISAPRAVEVHREEVWLAKQRGAAVATPDGAAPAPELPGGGGAAS